MIANNLGRILQSLGNKTRLVAVTKTRTIAEIMELYQAGQRIMGENRVQELVEKAQQLPADIEWHLIGHLQTNKVKYIVPFVKLIHSVDSLKLAIEIDKQAARISKQQNVLLQAYVATEETKFGLDENELEVLLSNHEFQSLKNIRVCGIMGMATNTEDQAQVEMEFSKLAEIFRKLKEKFFKGDENFKELSMGMSGDYEIAMKQGSTLVRVGSALFR